MPWVVWRPVGTTTRYMSFVNLFFFSSRRRHTRYPLVTGRRVLFRSLLGIEAHVALHVLEPLHAIARGALQLEGFDFALILALLERGGNAAVTFREDARQGHRIFHG